MAFLSSYCFLFLQPDCTGGLFVFSRSPRLAAGNLVMGDDTPGIEVPTPLLSGFLLDEGYGLFGLLTAN